VNPLPNRPEREIHPSLICPASAFGVPAGRLGLASGLENQLTPVDIHHAIERGMNFLNWPGHGDAMQQAIGELGAAREQVVVCVQFEARTSSEAATELRSMLARLNTDYIDVLTFYYVETPAEWSTILAPGGALEFGRQARNDGVVRRLGITTHQRKLAAEAARSGVLDALMIRYNAAHRGAETEVFPVANEVNLPVITYTSLRWGALLHSTPDDPPGFEPARSPAWYRWVLQNPSVAVTMAAPRNRADLDEALTVLDGLEPLPPDDFERLAEHGRRVRRHGGAFP
jgi:predicted aldo/keto reductase-like oxidoreductase